MQREQTITSAVFGISIAEIVRFVPIAGLFIAVYVNQQNFNTTQQNFNLQQQQFNKEMVTANAKNSEAIGGIKEVLGNLNNYLSATTGKQFRDGVPR